MNTARDDLPRRPRTALVVLNAEASPWAARGLAAGAAAMGITACFDWHAAPAPHWLQGPLSSMVGLINPAPESYVYVDPCAPAEDTDCMLEDSADPWLVVLLNDGAAAQKRLVGMERSKLRYRVLLVQDGPAGVLLVRCASVREAALLLIPESTNTPLSSLPPGPPEHGFIAAGAALAEVVCGARKPLHGAASLIGFYSHHEPSRVAPASIERLFELRERLGVATGPMARFAGRRIQLVGAGALANYAAWCLAADGPIKLKIWDGDFPERRNLSSQIIYAPRLASGKSKAELLAEELGALDRKGTYEGITKFIRSADDLRGHEEADLRLCLPDNDQARFLTHEAGQGILFGTAGSSLTGSQAVVSPPGKCFRCVWQAGIQSGAPAGSSGESCALSEPSIVATNLIGAGLLISELRIAVSKRRPPANVRFMSVESGNQFGRMITNPAPCGHVP